MAVASPAAPAPTIAITGGAYVIGSMNDEGLFRGPFEPLVNRRIDGVV